MKNKKLQPLKEVAEQLGLPEDIILQFISFRWIIPVDQKQHLLDEEDAARVHLIWELQQEFGVNNEAIPIILNLIDQLNRIHLELKSRARDKS
jgi:chaperone modulatory protein CbpM